MWGDNDLEREPTQPVEEEEPVPEAHPPSQTISTKTPSRPNPISPKRKSDAWLSISTPF